MAVTPQAVVPYSKASSTGLLLPKTLDEKRWKEIGQFLIHVEGSVQWWIGDWWRFGEQHYGDRKAWAEEAGFSFQTCANAGAVSGAVETSRRREVLSWSHHAEVVALEPDEQDRLLDEAEREDWTRNELRAAVRRHQTGVRIGKKAGEAEPLAALGQYQVLYADPPWEYEHAEPTRAIDNNYWPASLDEIKALGADLPAADDSVLLCWATSPKLEEAIGVLHAWDFEYRTCLAWVKGEIEHPTMGMCYYARQAHELLLVAKRGELPVPAPENRPLSVFAAPRGEHSEKPELAYEIVERMYPDFSKVELFARRTRDGWYAWGDQA